MSAKKHLLCLMTMFACLLLWAVQDMRAEDKMKEAKSWLAAHSDPAEINVDGIWDSDAWAKVLLHQAKNTRVVTGTSDNYEIEGVVSGKKVFLVFFYKGRLGYTAEIAPDDTDSLIGTYDKGILRSESGRRLFVLSRVVDVQTPASAHTDKTVGAPARVVVYREHYYNCPQVKARIYVDGKEAAELQNGRYLTLILAPGKHLIGTSTVGYMGSQTNDIDLTPGSTSYIHFDFPSAWVCKIEISEPDAAYAESEISKLKPNDAKRVKIPEMVSLDPIGVK
jgi:hypothetical protein